MNIEHQKRKSRTLAKYITVNNLFKFINTAAYNLFLYGTP